MSQTIQTYRSEPDAATTIYCLTDITATFPFPAPAVMPTVSAAEWIAIQQRYPQSFAEGEKLVAQVACYLLRQDGRTILVDTGLGETFTNPTGGTGHGQLAAQLQQIGVAPDEVDLVFHTHLHPDHVGWNVRQEADGPQPTFANARYLAPRLDWAMYERMLAEGADGVEHVRTQLLPLYKEGMLELVEGEVGLAEHICAFPTPGHSPGHMSVQINTNSDNYLIAGDAFFHPLQFATPTHYTRMDGMNDAAQANATRAHLLARIGEEKLLVSACHFFHPGFGRIVEDEQGRYWQPI